MNGWFVFDVCYQPPIQIVQIVLSYLMQTLASSRQRREEKEQEQLELLYPDNETVQPTSSNVSQGD